MWCAVRISSLNLSAYITDCSYMPEIMLYSAHMPSAKVLALSQTAQHPKLKLLVKCANLVIKEIAGEYLPLMSISSSIRFEFFTADRRAKSNALLSSLA